MVIDQRKKTNRKVIGANRIILTNIWKTNHMKVCGGDNKQYCSFSVFVDAVQVNYIVIRYI